MTDIRTGYEGWSDWLDPGEGGRIRCGRCALTHDIEMRVHEGRPQFRLRRTVFRHRDEISAQWQRLQTVYQQFRAEFAALRERKRFLDHGHQRQADARLSDQN